MNLRDKIWTWAKTLDNWQNDLLRRVYEEGKLDESGREQVLKNLLATLKGEELPFKPIRLNKDQIQTSISDNESVKVLSLSNLENVGTVTEKGRLDFLADGLTVIYGENGAGKSSYARVLKKACRAIKQDLDIHPNAFEKSNGEGTAKIKIQIEDSKEIIKRNVNDKPNPNLNSISIYDRECAEAYTEGKVMDIPYLPSDLRSMKQMVNEQNLIRESLQDEINKIKEEIESLEVELDEFPEDDKIYPIVNSLSHNTDLEKLSELRGLNDQEIEQLEKWEKELKASDPEKRQKKISTLESKKSDTKNIVDRLNKIDRNINKRLVEVFPNLIRDIQTLKDSQEMLKEEFENALPGTGNEAWKTLWKAAKNFSVEYAYKDKEFPVLEKDGNPAKCVLCQQPLEEKGIEERYNRFDKFIEHNIEKQLKEKRKVRDDYEKEIENLKLSDVLSELARNTLEENNKELTEKLDEIENTLWNCYKKMDSE
ncbi:AAA family ATPase, partial [Fodinibius halophilus]